MVHVINYPNDSPRTRLYRATSRRRGVRFHYWSLPAGGLAPALAPRGCVPNAVLLSITGSLKQKKKESCVTDINNRRTTKVIITRVVRKVVGLTQRRCKCDQMIMWIIWMECCQVSDSFSCRFVEYVTSSFLAVKKWDAGFKLWI